MDAEKFSGNNLGVSPKIGGNYPPNHAFVHRVFHEIFTIHFGGKIPLFLVQHPPGPSSLGALHGSVMMGVNSP